jgi:hypothetical protein
MHRNGSLLARGLALAALALSLGGCGGLPQYDVTGKVTYNGKALDKPKGMIVFVGPNGAQVPAQIGEDGTYTATKVSAGLNRVVAYYPNPDFKPPARPKGAPDANYRPVVLPIYLTPEKYATVDTSPLSVQVEAGTVFNVEMTGPDIP